MNEIENQLNKMLIQHEWLCSKLQLFKADMFREKIFLSSQEIIFSTLKNSISNLKKEGIISSLKEYDKMKKEIAIVKNRIDLSNQIIKHYEHNIEQTERDIKDTESYLEILKEKAKPKSNIIPLRKDLHDTESKKN